MKQKIFEYLRSTFSEADGTGSATRVLAGGGVLATIIWVSFLVFTQRHLPDLSGAALFVSSSFAGYGINKVALVMKDDKKDDKK